MKNKRKNPITVYNEEVEKNKTEAEIKAGADWTNATDVYANLDKEWYFGNKDLALEYFKTANQNYEDLQYDEPASFQHEVHNIYAGALLMSGQPAEALRVVDRGLIPYPNQLESVYIRMKALEDLHEPQELEKTKEHLSKLMTFSDFQPSLKNF